MKSAKKENSAKAKKDDFPGYPQYPSSEDIYNNAKEETELDPDTGKSKTPNIEPDRPNEKIKDNSGSDLDVPGSELDDAQEEIGSEDEENNFYSLGGDDHENQEEDKTQRED